MRNDYRTMLKRMTKEELTAYIDKTTDYMLAVGSDYKESTSPLTKILYAESLLKDHV